MSDISTREAELRREYNAQSKWVNYEVWLAVRITQLESRLKLYQEYNQMADKGYWQPPRPIFLLSESNDKMKNQLAAVRPLVHKWRSKPYRSEMSIKLSNELESAIGEVES